LKLLGGNWKGETGNLKTVDSFFVAQTFLSAVSQAFSLLWGSVSRPAPLSAVDARVYSGKNKGIRNTEHEIPLVAKACLAEASQRRRKQIQNYFEMQMMETRLNAKVVSKLGFRI